MSTSATGARDLTQGGVSKTLITFALPTLAVNILQTLNGTISAIFVGKMLGETALAASTIATMVMFAVFSLVFGFAMAATILIGQAAGRGDWTEVKRTTGAAFGMMGIAGLVIAAVGWFATPTFLKWMAAPPEVVPQAADYLRLTFIAMPIGMVNMLLPALLRGIGDSTSSLWNTALNVALCIVLNPLLIPLFGIEGAVLAGMLANLGSGPIKSLALGMMD